MSKTEELALANMTAGVSPAMRRMIAAEGAGLVADVRSDAGRGSVWERPPVLPSPDSAREHGHEPPRRGSGWVTARPLGMPAGVAACDRLADAAAEEDRRVRVREWLDRR
jgi:hypothetical protein